MSDLSSEADFEREQARILDDFELYELASDRSGSVSDADMSSAASLASDDALSLGERNQNSESDGPQEDRGSSRSASSSHEFSAALENEGFAGDGASDPSTTGASRPSSYTLGLRPLKLRYAF